ncbi:MAG: glycosyltransferase [Candidatus Scalindua sediminis]|nr:glycosyltransferase [Candidatus Scalindua sediminis]
MIKILHLTAHLGGGVGKALSGLVLQSVSSRPDINHTIVTLEEQEKPQFIELIKSCGGEVITCPTTKRLNELIETSDIVQLEWWNHPVTIRCLCSLSAQPMRLLSWSHGSGLFNPTIPKKLVLASHTFLFTSKCSLENPEITDLAAALGDQLGVVSSSGGFDGLPEPGDNGSVSLAAGYIGSLNFAKLHPRYVDFILAVNIPRFKVRLIGDVTNKDILEQQCVQAGRPGMLEFRGYTKNVASELVSINVLAYLLNPEHYGTTENALLEAMAMGVVPIVLDNPAERQIVDDHKTGLIVHSPDEFAEAIQWLFNNPDERQRLGSQASKSVRERFSAEKMEASLNVHYRKILYMEKREIDFSDIFGADSADWFLSCQCDKTLFAEDGSIKNANGDSLSYGLFEKSKGTAFHFSEHFPDNVKLKSWAKNLKLLQ